ncbi:MAG: hypothetical protein A3H64_03050 [Candidatus Ryanbacteria bacterium RIFCSPLOWO2_02_FULL_45_11c]|uniref:Uncharacterized protein n=1 Tax=Candidatus Ryanbacteria bacterium RIFCSPLOWO2_02_FULL_45_11c TaxID=1802128 RepID=A0A1G2H378_9BACT|nr:MAG: hypothetical protein A3H64_03050 [Candidatus Ryanbacteria bacterium RIFCSPLOWO2_02_FULL_45_11c]
MFPYQQRITSFPRKKLPSKFIGGEREDYRRFFAFFFGAVFFAFFRAMSIKTFYQKIIDLLNTISNCFHYRIKKNLKNIF